jgi:hypothetical protein
MPLTYWRAQIEVEVSESLESVVAQRVAVRCIAGLDVILGAGKSGRTFSLLVEELCRDRLWLIFF